MPNWKDLNNQAGSGWRNNSGLGGSGGPRWTRNAGSPPKKGCGGKKKVYGAIFYTILSAYWGYISLLAWSELWTAIGKAMVG